MAAGRRAGPRPEGGGKSRATGRGHRRPGRRPRRWATGCPWELSRRGPDAPCPQRVRSPSPWPKEAGAPAARGHDPLGRSPRSARGATGGRNGGGTTGCNRKAAGRPAARASGGQEHLGPDGRRRRQGRKGPATRSAGKRPGTPGADSPPVRRAGSAGRGAAGGGRPDGRRARDAHAPRTWRQGPGVRRPSAPQVRAAGAKRALTRGMPSGAHVPRWTIGARHGRARKRTPPAPAGFTAPAGG